MSDVIEGRAQTAEQKKEVIEQLYQLWICLPGLRFGQMLLNWANGHDEDFYNIEDRQFIESLNAFYDEMGEWHGKETSMNRIPRRASRNLWHRFKRWWHRFWSRDTVIYFDEAAKKGVMITFRYSGSYEEDIKR